MTHARKATHNQGLAGQADRQDGEGPGHPQSRRWRGSEQKQCRLSRASVCDLVKHHFSNDGAALLAVLKMPAGTCACWQVNMIPGTDRPTDHPPCAPSQEGKVPADALSADTCSV